MHEEQWGQYLRVEEGDWVSLEGARQTTQMDFLWNRNKNCQNGLDCGQGTRWHFKPNCSSSFLPSLFFPPHQCYSCQEMRITGGPTPSKILASDPLVIVDILLIVNTPGTSSRKPKTKKVKMRNLAGEISSGSLFWRIYAWPRDLTRITGGPTRWKTLDLLPYKIPGTTSKSPIVRILTDTFKKSFTWPKDLMKLKFKRL